MVIIPRDKHPNCYLAHPRKRMRLVHTVWLEDRVVITYRCPHCRRESTVEYDQPVRR